MPIICYFYNITIHSSIYDIRIFIISITYEVSLQCCSECTQLRVADIYKGNTIGSHRSPITSVIISLTERVVRCTTLLDTKKRLTDLTEDGGRACHGYGDTTNLPRIHQ